MQSIVIPARTQSIAVGSNTELSLDGPASSPQEIIVGLNKEVSVVSKNLEVIIQGSSGSGTPGADGLPGPPGPPGSSGAASGEVTIPAYIWVLDHDLGMFPAAFRFFNESGEEFEPIEVTYINPNRVVAQWPELMSGSWVLS